ncbi:sterol regulatory element-binding protein cleavage-activating protein [Agrilus planipennis]|uniref:Sterol regulatory element-binding protein cleavage-activating protein n=1 Tax=Agrilus planipennis TaxID=224129 RepID=A0A1W4WPE7_AGRPL|nr:sterol regulatory element-binding protein cleavage-activating protein [Agrilus planipennis]
MNALAQDTRPSRGATNSAKAAAAAKTSHTRGKHPTGLQDKVAQLYYSHGLFCSTYPATVISIAISVVLLCCYPLLNLPLPGNSSIQIWNTINESTKVVSHGGDPPWCYVQQIVVRSSVVPWDQTLHLGDAFRAPLYEAFKLLEVVRNYEDPKSLKTFDHVCLHVESLKKTKDERNYVFPEYGCLILSPANLWHQDVQQFMQDSSILSTIFNHQDLQKGKISHAELLFGMHMSDTGIKRYPLRNRQRVLQYAITLFLRDYNEAFVSGLKNKLQKLYPLNQNVENSTTTNNEIVSIYYPDELNYSEFIPLGTSFCLLFVYYYFSVRKIELIKSKCGMAFTAVMTVLGSLTMTLGLCFFFGLTLSLRVKEIFPYLVILVGLENVLVLTKSVTSAPLHLDIKIRVAQGLSKEGWSITKTLLIEITILTIGLFTFVPAIQELCIFAIVGLLTDFFLQMLFFSTILSVDIKRKENLVEKNNISFRNALYQGHFYPEKTLNTGMNRSKSHPKLSSAHTDVVASQSHQLDRRIPKRVKLVNIWARTRFFQRAFMFLMVVWIGRILYDSGIVENYFLDSRVAENRTNDRSSEERSLKFRPQLNRTLNVNFLTDTVSESDIMKQKNHTEELRKLRHPEFSTSRRLSAQHWPTILKKYNISVSGRSVVILPSIKLSHAISPEQAALLRNSEEVYGQKFQWQALAAALDPIDFTDSESDSSSDHLLSLSERPFYPNSPMEIFLTTILCFISIIVMAYTFVVLYRCICSRNYAEWRASWFNNGDKTEENDVPVLLEAVPIVLKGHPQEIECIVTDGFSAASSCLGGQIKVWDTNTGDLLAKIDRNSLHNNGPCSRSPELSMDNGDDCNLSDYESGSPASHDDLLPTFPSLQHKININFSGLRLRADRTNTLYDFGNDYRELYAEFQRLQRLKRRNNDTARWVHVQRQYSRSGDFEIDNNGGMTSYDCLEKDEALKKSPRNYKCEFFNDSRATNGGINSNDCVNKPSPIWCMDYVDNLIAIGCADGTLEFWEGTTGKFKCLYNDNSGVAITSIKIIGSRAVVVRLLGTVDFLQLQTFNHGRPVDWNFTSAYRRTHTRTASAGSLSEIKNATLQDESLEEMVCLKVMSLKAHQQPITCLDSEGGRVVTGSQDHTLKVFRLDNGSALYTLHGHYGPITSLFIDRVCPATSGSGSQDGTLCVWDLLTGACMYSNKAHDGAITSLTYSASYVISLGMDERLCIWERFQGHLLNTINVSNSFPTKVMMLTPHLVLTTRQGGLVVWDVRTGECVRTIVLGRSALVFVNQMIMLRDSVLCDFGNELRIVRFPLITHKCD